MNSFSRPNPKIQPKKQHLVKPDGTPADNDRVEIGPSDCAFAEWQQAGLAIPNLELIREYRLTRLWETMEKHDTSALLVFDPLNIRYATDAPNMQLWITHNFCRACLIIPNAPIILWDFHNCEHLSAHNPRVGVHEHGASAYYFETGDKTARNANEFAGRVQYYMQKYAGKNCKKLAIDKADLAHIRAFDNLNIELTDGQEITELARAIKSGEEIKAMNCAIHACELSIREMENAMRPGISENELWAHLHFGNIKRGGEWIETRLLSSGVRTNPWFAECGPRIIQAGDIVSFDTDLIGVWGVCVDISRSFICDGTLQGEMRSDYQMAMEQIAFNSALLKPGVSFRELTEKSFKLAEKYRDNRYGVVYHGVGLCDEYPSIRYPEDYEACGYDGVLAEGMCLCVESLICPKGGKYSIKLEEQVVITKNGYQTLSHYPFLI